MPAPILMLIPRRKMLCFATPTCGRCLARLAILARPTAMRSLTASACGIGKTVIKRKYFERWRPMLSGYESRRQLQCIGHAAGEHEETYRRLSIATRSYNRTVALDCWPIRGRLNNILREPRFLVYAGLRYPYRNGVGRL